MRIRTFTQEDIKSASELLSIRHKRERHSFEGLNPGYENSTMTEKIIQKSFENKASIGVIAQEHGEVVGYLLSILKEDNLFGRCAWIRYEGMAISEEVDEELYRHMYEVLAKQWVELGYLKHIVFVPVAVKATVEAWLQLGFSYEQAYGVMSLENSGGDMDQQGQISHGKASSKVTIRLAEPQDKDNLESISGLILSYQAKSPVFAIAPPELFAEIQSGYGGLIEDDDAHVLLAYEDDKFLGFTCGYFEDSDTENMMTILDSFELGVAGTNPAYQSKGIGRMLTQRLFQDAILKDYKYSVTDWRVTNLKSSIFWPKIGYKPYAYRMVRTIDSRILWANGDTKF